jgi:hypothetical protein
MLHPDDKKAGRQDPASVPQIEINPCFETMQSKVNYGQARRSKCALQTSTLIPARDRPTFQKTTVDMATSAKS